MGILDKARTKARTAPVVIRSPLPFELGASWRLQNGLAAAALLRGAFARIDTRRLQSGTLRGRHGAISRFVNEQASSLWFVQSDDATCWKIQLGLRGQKKGEYFLDWQVRVDCRENGDAVEATINTPSYLARDGALVNGKTHDQLRDLLVAAFRGVDRGGEAAEVELAELSMTSSMLDEVADFTRFADCEIRTVLTDEKLAEVLRHVCMPLVESTARQQIFRLGPDRPGVARSTGCVAWDDVRDEAGVRTLRLTFALHPVGSLFLDALTYRAALGLAKRLYAYVSNEDESLRWTGPDLYSWVW